MATKSKTKKSETKAKTMNNTNEVEEMKNESVVEETPTEETNETEAMVESNGRGRVKGVKSKKYYVSVEELNKLGKSRVQITGKQRQVFDMMLEGD